METLARLGILWLTLFLIMFPYGALFARRRVGPRLGFAVGALAGLAAGLILGGPDYEPRAANVVVIVVLTLLSAVGIGVGAAASERLRPNESATGRRRG